MPSGIKGWSSMREGWSLCTRRQGKAQQVECAERLPLRRRLALVLTPELLDWALRPSNPSSETVSAAHCHFHMTMVVPLWACAKWRALWTTGALSPSPLLHRAGLCDGDIPKDSLSPPDLRNPFQLSKPLSIQTKKHYHLDNSGSEMVRHPDFQYPFAAFEFGLPKKRQGIHFLVFV